MIKVLKNFTAGHIIPAVLHYSVKNLNTAFESILPSRCNLCLAPDRGGYCLRCQSLLPWLEHGCQQCGQELPAGEICGTCQSNPAAFDNSVVPFRYLDPISSHIQHLKYDRRLAVAPALGKILAMQVIKQTDKLPDALIPVPLHRGRLKQRGFNQANLIAESVGRLLGIPVDYRVISREKETKSQTNLDRRSREENVRNAFAVDVIGRYDAIAVIDDVITSGATISAVCSALRRNGYTNISAWAVART